jgi:hypothetical protein
MERRPFPAKVIFRLEMMKCVDCGASWLGCARSVIS